MMVEDVEVAGSDGRLPVGTGLSPSVEPIPVSPPHGASIPSAEPIVLVALGDPENEPLLYACGKCGSVHSPNIYAARGEVAHDAAKAAAADCYNCKTSNICACGAECPKYWTACEDCRNAKKLAAAVEVPDDGGPYCAFGGDTYYHELEEAAADGLEWVSPCHITYPRINAESVLENLLDEMHEDASVDDLDATDAFFAAVKAFNDAQRTRSWFGDDTRKIRVPASAMSARSAETVGLGPQDASAIGDCRDAQGPSA